MVPVRPTHLGADDGADLRESVRLLHFGVLTPHPERGTMSKLLRGLAAGHGAKTMGGEYFDTVLIFLVLWWLLGHFGIFR